MTPGVAVCHYFAGLRSGDGGVARAVADLARAGAALGDPVVVLAHPGEGPSLGAGVREVLLPAAPTPFLGRAGRSAVAAALTGCAVLHLHEVWDPAALQVAAVARRRGLPYVLSTHGSLDAWSMRQKPMKKRAYLRLGGRRLLEGAAAVLCAAEPEAMQAARWFRGTPVVLPLLMDLSEYANLPGPGPAGEMVAGLDPAAARLVFVGRLHHGKGLEHLIDAVATLRHEGIGCVAVIAGGGEARYVASLRRRVAAHRLQDRVRFPGVVSGPAKVSLLAWGEVFVLPTAHENWGIALFEALAAGTPVVTTPEVGVWRDLERSGGATIAPRAATASAIAAVLADPARVDRGRAARAWVLREHAPAAAALRYRGCYEEVVRTRLSARPPSPAAPESAPGPPD